jgi:hypothetical protein
VIHVRQNDGQLLTDPFQKIPCLLSLGFAFLAEPILNIRIKSVLSGKCHASTSTDSTDHHDSILFWRKSGMNGTITGSG